MKKFLTIALLIIVGSSYAQESFDFKIYDLTITTKAGDQAINDTIYGSIYLDTELSLDLYKEGNTTYFAQIEMRRSGNRVKLKERWLVKNSQNGEILGKTKWIKTVHFIKNSFVGEINGYTGQQVLIDKGSYKFIKASYKRSLTYGNN